MTTRGIHTHGGKRRHPPAKVGDRVGDAGEKIVALLPRDRTSNERVRVRCPEGHEREGYTFNLRKARTCPECELAKLGPRLNVRIQVRADGRRFIEDRAALAEERGTVHTRLQSTRRSP